MKHLEAAAITLAAFAAWVGVHFTIYLQNQ